MGYDALVNFSEMFPSIPGEEAEPRRGTRLHVEGAPHPRDKAKCRNPTHCPDPYPQMDFMHWKISFEKTVLSALASKLNMG